MMTPVRNAAATTDEAATAFFLEAAFPSSYIDRTFISPESLEFKDCADDRPGFRIKAP